ncbi:MAG: hypothetical protein IVW57_00460 [Ktedonobacterales bacterium]|nr:hypothetical protein [Ktedonobacterales bacterium]
MPIAPFPHGKGAFFRALVFRALVFRALVFRALGGCGGELACHGIASRGTSGHPLKAGDLEAGDPRGR